ncbi:unnamed protein product [Choristocarpus tenellus]
MFCPCVLTECIDLCMERWLSPLLCVLFHGLNMGYACCTCKICDERIEVLKLFLLGIEVPGITCHIVGLDLHQGRSQDCVLQLAMSVAKYQSSCPAKLHPPIHDGMCSQSETSLLAPVTCL